MSYCPLSCSSHGYMPSCKSPECELTDEAGDCLIKQALACYVQDKREERAAREQIAKSALGSIFSSIRTSEPVTSVGY
jgi:hypothetical protein